VRVKGVSRTKALVVECSRLARGDQSRVAGRLFCEATIAHEDGYLRVRHVLPELLGQDIPKPGRSKPGDLHLVDDRERDFAVGPNGDRPAVETRSVDGTPQSCGQRSKAPPRILSDCCASAGSGARARPIMSVTASLISGVGTPSRTTARGLAEKAAGVAPDANHPISP